MISDADAPAPGASHVAAMGRGTLARQLVFRVTVLVAAVAIVLSALTITAMNRILQNQQDAQILELVGRGPKDHGPGDGDVGGGFGPQDGLLYYGTTVSRATQQYSQIGMVQHGGTQVTLSTTAQKTLDEAKLGAFTTVSVEGVGPYRVYAYTGLSGNRNVVGLPSSLISKPILALFAAAAAFTLAAIALAFFGARTLVQRALLPLQRLASTAHQVSTLELDTGEVNVPVRVAPSGIDPRSEVGQVGIAFNHMLDNVEGALHARQASEMKVRQFVADASHELRNPLASISGYAELTRRERDVTPPTTAVALGRIESETARMSALVEDLLLLARLDSGPQHLTLAPTPLNDLIAHAVMDAQVAGPDHDWEVALPPAEVVAVGDPFRLTQVVANLLSNARTHTPPGTHVRTSLTTEGDVAVIRVSDDGPGIPEAIRDTVFERFTRADASRVRSGQGPSTGLGLAIVAAVMQAHRGTATVASSDAGTTFTLRVPLAVEEV